MREQIRPGRSVRLYIMAAIIWSFSTKTESQQEFSDRKSFRVIMQPFFPGGGHDPFVCYGECKQTDEGLTGETKVIRCEGSTIRLKCPSPYVIRIQLAVYGKLDAGRELCRPQDMYQLPEQCREDVTSIMSRECSSQQRCQVDVNEKEFKHPCEGKFSYLDVRHSCVPPPTTPRPTRPKTTTRPSTSKLTAYATTISDTTTKLTTKNRSTKGKGESSSTQSKTHSTIKKTTKGTSTGGASTSTGTSTGQESSTIYSGDGSVSSTDNPLTITPKMSGKRDGMQEEGSMFWLMTTYSLLTDRDFIAANVTHLALAVILAIFIGSVLSVCFVLDHCRRVKLRKMRKLETLEDGDEQLNLESTHENGPILEDYEMREVFFRSMNKSRQVATTMNGSIPRSSENIDDPHEDIIRVGERVPLLSANEPLPNDRRISDISNGSSNPENLPPPPKELLADTPTNQTPRTSYVRDEEDSSSSASLPPPPDAERYDMSTFPGAPRLIITSPTPTNSSVSSSIQTYGTSPRSSPKKVSNEKRLNNEVYTERKNSPRSKPTTNLLQNNVSVQTNELNKLTDLQHRLAQSQNPNFVDIPDMYVQADLPSELGDTNLANLESATTSLRRLQQISEQIDVVKSLSPDSYYGIRSDLPSNQRGGTRLQQIPTSPRGKLISQGNIRSSFDGEGNTPGMQTQTLDRSSDKENKRDLGNHSPKKGRLRVLHGHKSLENGVSSSKDDMTDSIEYCPHSTDGSLSRRILSSDDDGNQVTISDIQKAISPFGSKQDTLTKQIYAVPKHRCGSGHDHSCICVPVRTGSNSFTCACLEKAKHGNPGCCLGDCTEQEKDDYKGEPYSPKRPRPGKGQSDTVRKKSSAQRKGYKEHHSLSDSGTGPPYSRSQVEESGYHSLGSASVGTDSLPNSRKSTDFEDGCATTSRIPRVSAIKRPKETSYSLDRGLSRRTGNEFPMQHDKMIPVIVHTSTNKTGRRRPRFEGAVPVEIRPSESTSDDTDAKDGVKVVVRSKSPQTKNQRHSGDFSNTLSDSAASPSEVKDIKEIKRTRKYSLDYPLERDQCKNGNVRLSPISEVSGSRKSTSVQSPQTSPEMGRANSTNNNKFKIQVVQTIDVNKHRKARKV